MVVRLQPDLEKVLKEKADSAGKTVDEVVDATLRQALAAPQPSPAPTSEDQDAWVRRLRSAASAAGVSLTNEQLSRESIYED